jgi:transposase
MRDTELYQQLLGLAAPWTVQRVELSVTDGRVDVWVEHPPACRFGCPECGARLPVRDHAEQRSWRHLDSCQFLTYLHARPPRVDCPEHGVHQARLPWAEPMSRFTTLFERLAIDVLQACDVKSAAGLLRISWDEAWHLMSRAVARGLAAKPPTAPAHLGVDEKAAGAGQDYLTVVSNLDTGTVEYLADERRKASLDAYFTRLSPAQRERIRAVAMDMWEPYITSVREHLPDPDSRIVFDRFHVMRYLTTAVDTVRKREHRALAASGDMRLVGSKYLWLYSAENLPARHGDRFAALRTVDLKTSRAWAIKESLRHLWNYHRRGWGEKHWRRWYFWATHSRLQPVIDAAHTLKRHQAGLLSYFAHRITNAGAESLNSRIQAIRVAARGYRNRNNFKTAIYFHCGGLQLHPATVSHGIPG